MELEFKKLDGHAETGQAKEFVQHAIQSGVPVMYLMLKHTDITFDEYEWHWFNLTGYITCAAEMEVTFATWGKSVRSILCVRGIPESFGGAVCCGLRTST